VSNRQHSAQCTDFLDANTCNDGWAGAAWNRAYHSGWKYWRTLRCCEQWEPCLRVMGQRSTYSSRPNTFTQLVLAHTVSEVLILHLAAHPKPSQIKHGNIDCCLAVVETHDDVQEQNQLPKHLTRVAPRNSRLLPSPSRKWKVPAVGSSLCMLTGR
jgi:hypothetical protein